MTVLTDRVSGVAESITLAVTQKAKKLKSDGVDVIGFAAGEPDFDTPEPIKKAAIDAINAGKTKYTPAAGTPELKAAIAKKLKEENDLTYDPSSIIISCGAKHSLYNIIQTICQRDDEVLIIAPYWVSYPEMARLAEAKPVIVQTREQNGYRASAEDIAAAITEKTKLIILNSPSNPAGIIYSREELKAIGELAVSKGIYIISDEIYESLLYDDAKHVSIGSLSDQIKERTFTVNGVSKSFSMTGWRIGYTAGPADCIKAISKLQSHSTSNPCSISQAAALAAFDMPREFFDQIRAKFTTRRDLLIEKLQAINNVRPITPKGAFYVFCDISTFGMPSVPFCEKLLDEARIAFVPGAAFGFDQFVRISFATSEEMISQGMDRFCAWAQKGA